MTELASSAVDAHRIDLLVHAPAPALHLGLYHLVHSIMAMDLLMAVLNLGLRHLVHRIMVMDLLMVVPMRRGRRSSWPCCLSCWRNQRVQPPPLGVMHRVMPRMGGVHRRRITG